MQSPDSRLTLTEAVPGSHIYVVDDVLDRPACANIIERFESHADEQYPGRVGQTENENLSIKRSTDIVVSGKPHWEDVDRLFYSSLAKVVGAMREKHEFFRGRFKDYGYAVQKTSPGEFYHWHVDGGSHSFSDRQLVIIWYLNDVDGPGGETEFRHYDFRVQPQAGRMLVFPPFWTHEHRGVTLESGVKYIATTWVMFA